MDKSIIAGSTTPNGVAGKCPDCGAPLHNPSMKEHKGLSMMLRWTIRCPKCGTKVAVENPRYHASPPTRIKQASK